jgi:uncharacterized BrkB/YihY/UPF0761 family membrane protein
MNILGPVTKAIAPVQTAGVDLYTKVKANLTKDNIVKYLIQGIAVGAAAYYLPNRKSKIQEVFIIALVASLSFLLLDTIHKC